MNTTQGWVGIPGPLQIPAPASPRGSWGADLQPPDGSSRGWGSVGSGLFSLPSPFAGAPGGNRGIFVRSGLAQRCPLSPLGTGPSGTALSPAPARGMLRDSVSWELLCVVGGGCWRSLGFFWVGDVELAQQRESPPMFLFDSPGSGSPKPGQSPGWCLLLSGF